MYLENKLSNEKYEKYKAKIKEMTLLDDTFARVIFKDEKCANLLIQIILENKSLVAIDVQTQKDYKNLHGRSVIMDIVAQDNEGNIYNIEVQRDDKGATPRRARYHSGLLDMNTTNPSEYIDIMKNSYVIFITENDILKKDRQIYHIKRYIVETGEEFGDGSNIVYVNASRQEDSDIGRLMHDFNCKNPREMYFEELKNNTVYFKEDDIGEKKMCKIMQELIDEETREAELRGELRGELKGELKGKIIGGITMLKNMSMSKEDIISKISESFNIPKEEATNYVNIYY